MLGLRVAQLLRKAREPRNLCVLFIKEPFDNVRATDGRAEEHDAVIRGAIGAQR
jgi:hypothetical protein